MKPLVTSAFGFDGRNLSKNARVEPCAKKGVFITTSSFTKEALASATKRAACIVLIDGEKLATLMIDHGLGVSLVASYEVKRIDADYFAED